MHCLQSRNFLQDIHAGEQKESFHFAEPQTIMFHRHFAVSRYIYIIRKDEEETESDDMQELMIHIMDTYGYLGVCFLIAIENIFPPIPSEVILTFGGFMTTYTKMNVPGVVIFSTLGSTIGALVLYGVGSSMTPDRLARFSESRLFKLLGFDKEEVERTMKWFEKKGKKAILFGRCVPIIRSLISIPAGMAQVPMMPFLLYTVIGSTVWNILLVSIGAMLGASWETVLIYLERYALVIRILLIGGITFWLVRYITKKMSGKTT